MKKGKTQFLKVCMGVLFIIPFGLNAQEKSNEEGDIKVIMVKDENGEISKIEKSFSLEDKAKVQQLLKEQGVDFNLESIEDSYKFKVDEKGENLKVMVKVIENEEESDEKVKKTVNVYRYNVSSSSENDELNEKLNSKKEISEVDIEKWVEEATKGTDKEVKYIIKKVEIDSDEEISNEPEVMVFFRSKSSLKNKENLPTEIKEEFEKSSTVQKLNLFPNPTNNQFEMSFISKEPRDYNLSIIDAKGSVIYENQLNNFQGNFSEDFDFSVYEGGVYFFNLKSDTEKVSKKIIVQ